MNTDKLHKRLGKFGSVEMLKAGTVFTLLITGTNLSNMIKVLEIKAMVTDFLGDNYPVVECLKNDDTFFLMVLREA
jgi:hypothetical protein